MIAKTWKKFLMAICIIAILFNIVNKLVARTNLKEQLVSVIGGDSIFSSVDKNNNGQSSSSEYVDGIRDNTQSNSDITGTTQYNGTNDQNGGTIYNEQPGQTNIENNNPNIDTSKIQPYVDNAIDAAGRAASTVDNKITTTLTDETEENKKRVEETNKWLEAYDNGNWGNQIGDILDGYMNR